MPDKTSNNIRAMLSSYMNTNIPSNDTELLKEGYLDSLSFVKMLSLVEKKFDIHIAIEELDIEQFKTVDDIAQFVKAKIDKGT